LDDTSEGSGSGNSDILCTPVGVETCALGGASVSIFISSRLEIVVSKMLGNGDVGESEVGIGSGIFGVSTWIPGNGDFGGETRPGNISTIKEARGFYALSTSNLVLCCYLASFFLFSS